MLLAGWMMVTLVLSRSYAGNLMSLLAVRHIPQPYQSLQAAIDDPSVSLIWEAESAYVQSLRSATSGVYKKAWDLEEKGRMLYQRSTEFPESVDKLLRPGRSVLILEELTEKVFVAQDFSNIGRCDFYLSKELFLPLMFAMIGRKNSPLVPVLSARIRAVAEAGLYDFWMKDMVPNSTSCVHMPTTTTVTATLSLTNLSGMFLVLAGGYVITLLVFGLELLLNKYLTNDLCRNMSPSLE
ncbi:ionotropic receptor 93a-like [Procambarus clarkii]|uniref:ionotropic receptor 93a-like n=1 Tax=Procambarus clarkii TaxID=6728 RepID=UPI001E678D23|nr:glutamate receptor ionotropic, delta-2-like [Procambarus clarkii]